VITRPQLGAQRRSVSGKHVRRLRREGILPGVVYGRGLPSESIQIDAREFDTLRRHAGRNALVDLRVDGDRARPVLLHAVQEHPVQRTALHVDLLIVRMTEEMTVDVPVTMTGESEAVSKLGGTLLHLRDTVQVRALPADLPSTIEADISSLADFDTMLHVSDLHPPERVTLLTDPSEPLARVQAPRVEEMPVVEAAEEVPPGEVGAEPPAEGMTEAPAGTTEAAER
jgi:large subunit ribosomal protein L25